MNEHTLNIFEKIEADRNPPLHLPSSAPTACESTKTTVMNVPRFRVKEGLCYAFSGLVIT